MLWYWYNATAVKKNFPAEDLLNESGVYCSLAVIINKKKEKSEYSESKNHDIDSKKCKPTVFIKCEDGLKRILRLEVKKPRASKRL